jgi:hypothetical protein
MTKERLKTVKSITTWSGVVITLSGIMLNLASGGSWQGNSLSLVGLVITCCGHWVTSALAKHQAAESAADKDRFDELESRFENAQAEMESMSEFLNKGGVFDRPESLRRIIREQDSIYEVEHQDDGR